MPSWEGALLIRVTRAFAVAHSVHVLCPNLAVSKRVTSALTKHFEHLTVFDAYATADALRVDAEGGVCVGTYDDMCMLRDRVALLAAEKAGFFSESAAVLVDYDRFSIGNILCCLRSDCGDIVSQSDIHSFLGKYKHCVELHT